MHHFCLTCSPKNINTRLCIHVQESP